jgi:hypothetical protein
MMRAMSVLTLTLTGRRCSAQDVMKPPGTGYFTDCYLVYELMDTDLHQVIRSSQPLSGMTHFALLPRVLRGLT